MYSQATFSTGHRFSGRQISSYEHSTNLQRTGEYNITVQPTLMNGNPTLNGLDVTHVVRSFTPDKITVLGSNGQRFLFTERDRLELATSCGPRGSGQYNYRRHGRGRGRGLEDYHIGAGQHNQ